MHMWVDISQCGFPDWFRIWLAERGYGAVDQSLVEDVRGALPLLRDHDGPRMMQYFHDGKCLKPVFMYPRDVLIWPHPFPFAVEKDPIAFEEPQVPENKDHLLATLEEMGSDRWLPLRDVGPESMLLDAGFTHYLAQYEAEIRSTLEVIVNHPDLRPRSLKLIVGTFRGVEYLNIDLRIWQRRFPFVAISPRQQCKRPAEDDIRGDEKRVCTEENNHARLIDMVGRSSVAQDMSIPNTWVPIPNVLGLCPEAVDWAQKNRYSHVCSNCITNINTAFANADPQLMVDFEAFFMKQINIPIKSSIKFSESNEAARYWWGMKFPFACIDAQSDTVPTDRQWNVFRVGYVKFASFPRTW